MKANGVTVGELKSLANSVPRAVAFWLSPKRTIAPSEDTWAAIRARHAIRNGATIKQLREILDPKKD